MLNEKRKIIEENILKKIKINKIKNNNIIILDNEIMNEGLIGIIASNITNYFNKPSVIITKSKNIYKGSARSTENFFIGKYIKRALDINLLESGGGHNLAAGFTVKKSNLNKFKNFLIKTSNQNYLKFKNKFLIKIYF